MFSLIKKMQPRFPAIIKFAKFLPIFLLGLAVLSALYFGTKQRVNFTTKSTEESVKQSVGKGDPFSSYDLFNSKLINKMMSLIHFFARLLE